MYIGQSGTIDNIVEEALRDIIIEVSHEPTLNDIETPTLARHIITSIVKRTSMQDFITLIDLYRAEQTNENH